MNKYENNSVSVMENRILLVRGVRVMLAKDLADLYGVSTKRLNEQVKRNLDRFPSDFMFQLTEDEKFEVVANCDHLKVLKYSPYLPFAFTEHGAVMLATVLNTPKAVASSIFVVKAFVKLREILNTHKELSEKLKDLESKFETHDTKILAIFNALNDLLTPPNPTKKRIGFEVREKRVKYKSKLK